MYRSETIRCLWQIDIYFLKLCCRNRTSYSIGMIRSRGGQIALRCVALRDDEVCEVLFVDVEIRYSEEKENQESYFDLRCELS